jgi:hypothetical protein
MPRASRHPEGAAHVENRRLGAPRPTRGSARCDADMGELLRPDGSHVQLLHRILLASGWA